MLFIANPLSRSTWACELKLPYLLLLRRNSQSRSTWACELKLWQRSAVCWIQKSRSTWACELKLLLTYTVIYDIMVMLHVSVWVEIQRGYTLFLMCKSRSTWACELKSYHLYFSEFQQKSRSTWACELKCVYAAETNERMLVTLHVSVWVEIYKFYCDFKCDYVTLHVSVWVNFRFNAGLINIE